MKAGAIGICTAKLSEAEALAGQGLDRICMTTSNPSPRKIRRAMQLRKRAPHFIQAVDDEQNARDLSAAAHEAGVVADVVIDVAVAGGAAFRRVRGPSRWPSSWTACRA